MKQPIAERNTKPTRQSLWPMVLLVVLVVTACASTGIVGALHGHTKQEVLELLGPPDTTRPAGVLTKEVWIWRLPGKGDRVQKRIVMFNRGEKVELALEFLERPGEQLQPWER